MGYRERTWLQIEWCDAAKTLYLVPKRLVRFPVCGLNTVKSEGKTELFTVILRWVKKHGKIHLLGMITFVAILSFSLGTAGGFLYADLQKK